MNELELQRQFALLCGKNQWVKLLRFMKANPVDLNSIYISSVYEKKKDLIPCAYEGDLLAMSFINSIQAKYSKGKLTVKAEKTLRKILEIAKLSQNTVDAVYFKLLDYGKSELILAVKELGLKCRDNDKVLHMARRKAGMTIVRFAKHYRFYSVAAMNSRDLADFKLRIRIS